MNKKEGINMIHDIKKVYENTIIQGKVESDKKEYICGIYKYLVSPKSFGVKENTYICYFEEIGKNHENNENGKDNENKKKMKNLIFITRLFIVNLLKYECNEKVLILEKK